MATDLRPAERVLRALDERAERLDDAELAAAISEMAALRVIFDACWLRLVGQADDRGIGRRAGFRTTGEWLACVAGERRGVMTRDVELAAALAESPVVAEGMRNGLSRAKAAELVEAGLPETEQQRLVSSAMTSSFTQVSAEVRRARLEHGVAPPEVEPSMTLVRAGDRVKLEATLDLVGGEFVEVALDTAAKGLSKDVPYQQRRAQALVVVARFFLDNAKKLPATRTGRPHAFVFVDLDTLTASTGGFATLGSGAVISGADARRLLCDANITRVVTKGRSQVLDIGLTGREPTVGLAKAVIARDRHCRFRNCHAPPWMCDIHHIQMWTKFGPTALHNLGLVCWYHHQETHRRGDDAVAIDDDGRWYFRDPERGRRRPAA